MRQSLLLLTIKQLLYNGRQVSNIPSFYTQNKLKTNYEFIPTIKFIVFKDTKNIVNLNNNI